MKMLLVEKKAKLKWNPANKKKYVDKGYMFTAWKEEFYVEIKDITKTTRATISMKCDFCGTEREMCYKKYNHILERSETKKDTCGKVECVNKKTEESNLVIYGYTSHNSSSEIQKKKVNTIKEKYGEEYVSPTQVPEVIEKIKTTNILKYGTEYAASSEIVRQKISNTNLEKYGSKDFMGTEEFFNKTRLTNIAKYGVESHTQTQEYKEKYSGENSFSWNHNLTKEERELSRNYPEYNLWRASVYERDNYECQCCGQNKTLNAHHLNGYHWNIEGRLDVSNGVTLCVDCHISFHRIYSKKNNTEEQYLEFFNNKLYIKVV